MIRPVFSELSLDLQIYICEFLHPLYILTLRQTCKAYHQATSQRIVWIHALNRICHHHSLFLPTFPILDMSISELEHAATAPSRWIALSSSKDRNLDEVLPSRTTRIIKNSIVNDRQGLEHLEAKFQDLSNPYLVPGGRYLVASSYTSALLGVWDLGYVSDKGMSSDGKATRVWATRVKRINRFIVQPTPDGLGIRILTYSLDNVIRVFEIYPQKETHEHAKIGKLTLNFRQYVEFFLCGNRAVIHTLVSGTIIVWDFMANTVASWPVSVPRGGFDKTIIRVTKTTIGIFYLTNRASPIIRIFQIPPLTTKTALVNKSEDLPEVAPILEFKDPAVIATYSQTPDSWYSGHDDFNSPPLYLGVRGRRTSNVVHQCTLDIASDLSGLSLTPIPNSEMAVEPRISSQQYYSATLYRICEDSSVYIFPFSDRGAAVMTVGSGLSSDCHSSSQTATTRVVNSARLANAGGYSAYSLCPASGRFVYVDRATPAHGFVISDFL